MGEEIEMVEVLAASMTGKGRGPVSGDQVSILLCLLQRADHASPKRRWVLFYFILCFLLTRKMYIGTCVSCYCYHKYVYTRDPVREIA